MLAKNDWAAIGGGCAWSGSGYILCVGLSAWAAIGARYTAAVGDWYSTC